MHEIRDGGRVVGIDRIAMLTALHITYDFLLLKKTTTSGGTDIAQHLQYLCDKIDKVVDEPQQLVLDTTETK